MTQWLNELASALLGTLEALTPMTVIGAFSLGLLVLAGLALAGMALGRMTRLQAAAPALLTTLGILGTFLGVAIGLLDFDAARVEASVPALLEGLKLAFVTSIVGIALAALLRLLQVLRPEPAAADDPDAAGGTGAAGGNGLPQDPALVPDLLREQRDAMQAVAQRLEAMDRGLEERQQRQHRETLEALDGLAERMSEMSSGHLVAALEQVIRDFNTRLGEQFGENFRRLDASVGRLLEWQGQYRDQMEELRRAFDQAREGMEHSGASLEKLTDQAFRITRHVEDQDATLSSLRRETVELEALLGSIAALRDRATEAFPAMDARLEGMLESLENAIEAGQAAQARWSATEGRSMAAAGGRS
ncbi:hypothetical protein [Thioalkalivibrio sp. ALE19]|uniref:hypothetical protein n=1 Tax=Thioalkalivibrio sp. ALE19 TaxID=1266909 RepID=UPI000421D42C|nr:hypothetical protein [Thioalkalivibrio sp. ALE19]